MAEAQSEADIANRIVQSLEMAPEVDEEEQEEAQEEAPQEVETEVAAEKEEEQKEEPKEPVIEIDPEAPLFEITVQGEKQKVSLAEMQKGYMMERDYRLKTADLAKQREAVKDDVKKQVEPVIQDYQKKVQLFQAALSQAIAPELQSVDWNKLATEEPAKFVQLQAKAQSFERMMKAAAQELERTQEEAKTQAQQFLKDQVEQARTELPKYIPDWSDALYQGVLKTGVDEYGFAPEEVGNTADYRMIRVLHDAHKYRQLQKAKPEVVKRAVSVPKVMKPGSAEQPSKAQNEQELQKRLRKSGNLDDAVQLYLARKR